MYSSPLYRWVIFNSAITHCSTFWLLFFHHKYLLQSKALYFHKYICMHFSVTEKWQFLYRYNIFCQFPSKGGNHFHFKPRLYEYILPVCLANTCYYWSLKFLPTGWNNTWYRIIQFCISSYVYWSYFPTLILCLCFAIVSSHSKFYCYQDFPRPSHLGIPSGVIFTSNNPHPTQCLEHSTQ